MGSLEELKSLCCGNGLAHIARFRSRKKDVAFSERRGVVMKQLVFSFGAVALLCACACNSLIGNISRAEAQYQRGDVRVGMDTTVLRINGNSDEERVSVSLSAVPFGAILVHGRLSENVLVGGSLGLNYANSGKGGYERLSLSLRPELEFDFNPRSDAVFFARIGASVGLHAYEPGSARNLSSVAWLGERSQDRCPPC